MVDGLTNGSRVAVVGGGVAGAGFATALLQLARARGRVLEVQVYRGSAGNSTTAVPALLTAECRSRLAALGCRVSSEWRNLELRGFEIISRGRKELLASAPNALWVMDDWPTGGGGMERLRKAIEDAAEASGARFVDRTATLVERHPVPQGTLSLAKGPQGDLVVRAGGAGERFHGVALATGARGGLGERFFKGFEGAPSVPAIHARLRYSGLRHRELPLARLILEPLPGADGLYLIPCPQSIYALAFGRAVEPADLCQALMIAARDGHLPEGFELNELSQTRIASGAGAELSAEGLVAVGASAVGHPFQIGVAETLSSASRGAVSLLENGKNARQLRRRYVHEGMMEILEDSIDAARALPWLLRAGETAPSAFPKARAANPLGTPFTGGILGLSSPTAGALLAQARRRGCAEWFRSFFRSSVEPLPSMSLVVEKDLYYVVDDDADAREALTAFLEAQGAEVVSFADELALYCAVARRPPTAILLDVVLNWVDGLRLAEGLKQHPLTRRSNVIVMSGLNRPYIRERALKAGALGFMPKPFDPHLLWQILGGKLPPKLPTDAGVRPGEPSIAAVPDVAGAAV